MGGVRRIVAEILRDLPRQARDLAVVVPVVCLVVAAVLLAVAWQNRVPVQFLVRDPSQTAQYPPYLGLVSYLGVLAWCAAAAISLFSGVVAGDRSRRALLLVGGGLSALLGIDDLLTLHEYVFPEYLAIDEDLVLLVYGLLVAGFLIGFLPTIVRRSDYLILGLALAFFAASELFDQGLMNQGLNYLLDDGLKLFGIVLWTTYLVRTSALALRQPAPGQGLVEARTTTPVMVAGDLPAGGAPVSGGSRER